MPHFSFLLFIFRIRAFAAALLNPPTLLREFSRQSIFCWEFWQFLVISYTLSSTNRAMEGKQDLIGGWFSFRLLLKSNILSCFSMSISSFLCAQKYALAPSEAWLLYPNMSNAQKPMENWDSWKIILNSPTTLLMSSHAENS
uniref:Secreted protein n=1 Tax=Spironucleus salmonicida TaxID=348837 RepID=V6M296_9EUKA|eukprot:EST47344.1 Hypothetical protein SS50377_12618 [Spironucleus salmonicida]